MCCTNSQTANYNNNNNSSNIISDNNNSPSYSTNNVGIFLCQFGNISTMLPCAAVIASTLCFKTFVHKLPCTHEH
jgi:hypothetical protein